MPLHLHSPRRCRSTLPRRRCSAVIRSLRPHGQECHRAARPPIESPAPRGRDRPTRTLCCRHPPAPTAMHAHVVAACCRARRKYGPARFRQPTSRGVLRQDWRNERSPRSRAARGRATARASTRGARCSRREARPRSARESQRVRAYTMMFTPKSVLSTAEKRLLSG